jgi:hypothetical protein
MSIHSLAYYKFALRRTKPQTQAGLDIKAHTTSHGSNSNNRTAATPDRR